MSKKTPPVPWPNLKDRIHLAAGGEHGASSWLARATKSTAQQVTNWKSRGVPVDMIPAIADALRCSVDELLGRTPSTWPFPDVAYQRFARLTPMQKGRVESAVLDTIEKIEGLGGKQTGTDG